MTQTVTTRTTHQLPPPSQPLPQLQLVTVHTEAVSKSSTYIFSSLTNYSSDGSYKEKKVREPEANPADYGNYGDYGNCKLSLSHILNSMNPYSRSHMPFIVSKGFARAILTLCSVRDFAITTSTSYLLSLPPILLPHPHRARISPKNT